MELLDTTRKFFLFKTNYLLRKIPCHDNVTPLRKA